MEERSKTLPLVEEGVRVDKREVVRGRVRVRTVTDRHEQLVEHDLTSERVEVERVPIDREVDEVPDVRREGTVMVIPVVEEVLFIEKRLILREEIHIRRTRSVEHGATPVELRRQEAVVERLDADGEAPAKEKNK